MTAVQSLAELRRLREDLRRVDPEMRVQVRRQTRKAGQSALGAAKAAASYSDRIPRALKLRVSMKASRPGVRIYAARGIAPHARPLEGIVRPTFRHPVFGQGNRRTVWVEQSSRPFLQPASKVGRDELLTGLRDALDAVLTSSRL